MIRLNNLVKIYSSRAGNEVKALDDVSLEIKDGEFAAVVGASGSGKTTLMNIIGCLDVPTRGEYFLDGRDVSKLSQKELSEVRSKKISFVFQGFNLIPILSAAENVELPLLYRGASSHERKRIARRALEAVGLSSREKHMPSELSGGQQQRVAIARALAANAPIILADEPCGNLDSRSGAGIMEMLRGLNRAGKTLVLITHDNSAALTAQRQIRISDGKILTER